MNEFFDFFFFNAMLSDTKDKNKKALFDKKSINTFVSSRTTIFQFPALVNHGSLVNIGMKASRIPHDPHTSTFQPFYC